MTRGLRWSNLSLGTVIWASRYVRGCTGVFSWLTCCSNSGRIHRLTHFSSQNTVTSSYSPRKGRTVPLPLIFLFSLKSVLDHLLPCWDQPPQIFTPPPPLPPWSRGGLRNMRLPSPLSAGSVGPPLASKTAHARYRTRYDHDQRAPFWRAGKYPV